MTNDDDSDGNVAGREVEATSEATEGNKHVPQHVWDWNKFGSSGFSVSEVTLPELLSKKVIESEVWYYFLLKYADRRPIEIDKLFVSYDFWM